jgi:hypothetical protein
MLNAQDSTWCDCEEVHAIVIVIDYADNPVALGEVCWNWNVRFPTPKSRGAQYNPCSLVQALIVVREKSDDLSGFITDNVSGTIVPST